MLGLLVPLLLVGWLVRSGIQEAEHHSKPDREREWLRRLKQRNVQFLSLADAEDGLVLSRRYGDRGSAEVFAKVVAARKKERLPV
jgi:hypothetical protein